jgi:hypothetical protein
MLSRCFLSGKCSAFSTVALSPVSATATDLRPAGTECFDSRAGARLGVNLRNGKRFPVSRRGLVFASSRWPATVPGPSLHVVVNTAQQSPHNFLVLGVVDVISYARWTILVGLS